MKSCRHIDHDVPSVNSVDDIYNLGSELCDQIYKCKKPCNGAWIHVDGLLKQIDGGKKYAYGVNSNDGIYAIKLAGTDGWMAAQSRQALTHLSLRI